MAKKVTKGKKAKAKRNGVVPKILIGVPTCGWTHEFAESFLYFWTDLMMYKHSGRRFHVGYKFVYKKPVHMAEEELAQFAVDSGCSHLLLMDDDIYDINAEMLMKLLDADKDVIGGIMHTSGFPHAMCAFRRYNRKEKVANMPILKGPARLYEVPPEQRTGVVKVDLIPFAFTLIKTKVFKNLKKPWFTCNTQAPTDSWFADRMLGKKFDYYAHFDVWLNHRGIRRDNRDMHVQIGLYEQRRKSGAQIIELSPDEMRRHEVLMTNKLAEAEKLVKKDAVGKQTFYEKSKGGAGAKPLGKR